MREYNWEVFIIYNLVEKLKLDQIFKVFKSFLIQDLHGYGYLEIIVSLVKFQEFTNFIIQLNLKLVLHQMLVFYKNIFILKFKINLK